LSPFERKNVDPKQRGVSDIKPITRIVFVVMKIQEAYECSVRNVFAVVGSVLTLFARDERARERESERVRDGINHERERKTRQDKTETWKQGR